MSATGGLLTVEQLRNQVDDGRIDTVLVAITDMQGRLQGKRCAAGYFLDEVVARAAEACSYLLARRRRHEHGRRLCHVVLGPRLRRLRAQARPVHTALGALARGHRPGALRSRLGGRQPGHRLAAADPAPPARPAHRAWAGGVCRHRARADRLKGSRTRMPGDPGTAICNPPTSTTWTTR